MKSNLVTGLILLLHSLVASAAPLVVYETESIPSVVHPLLTGGSLPSVHVSALTSLRAAGIDGARNRLALTAFSELKRRDARRYDLLLLPNIKWSDNRPFVANDVEASFRRVVEAGTSGGATESSRSLYRSLYLIESIQALDAGRAQIIFRQTTHPHEVLSFLALLPLTQAATEWSDLSKAGAPTLGPYMVSSVETDKIKLTANPNFYLGAPKIPAVEIVRVGDDELKQRLSEEGSSDIAPRIPSSLMNELKRNSTIILRPVDTRRLTYLGFNRNPGSCFEQTPGLRIAISSLIDRQGLQDLLLDVNGGGRLAVGPFSVGSPANDPGVEPPAYSPPLALQYLTDSQYRRVGESWRSSTGQALNIRLLVYSGVQNHSLIVGQLREQLNQEAIGINVTVIDRKQLTELLAKPRGDYDMILHEWVLDRGEDIFELYHSKGVYNFLGYSNSKIDERLELERRAALQESKQLYLREVHRVLSRDPAAIFLWQSSDVAAFRMDITNVPPLDNYFFFQDIHTWENGSSSGSSSMMPAVPVDASGGLARDLR